MAKKILLNSFVEISLHAGWAVGNEILSIAAKSLALPPLYRQ